MLCPGSCNTARTTLHKDCKAVQKPLYNQVLTVEDLQRISWLLQPCRRLGTLQSAKQLLLGCTVVWGFKLAKQEYATYLRMMLVGLVGSRTPVYSFSLCSDRIIVPIAVRYVLMSSRYTLSIRICLSNNIYRVLKVLYSCTLFLGFAEYMRFWSFVCSNGLAHWQGGNCFSLHVVLSSFITS